MKNFRKVLALILVVATLFSFAAMTSAKEYKDSDKISYDQAVDVLSAIGILEGYPDGSFKPADSIAREEMAKMVAVLSNAGDDVSELYASACKFGDTKDRWSASYVAYCNETGIVAGRNASTFDPRGRVTGIETAKMLLCLIGFDATAQGYVGTNWKTNVLRDAKAAGLLDGFAEDYDVAKAITREEAANMMLNALLAPMVVGTISNNVVTFSNKVWIDLTGDAIKVGSYMNLKDAAAKYDCYVLYGNVVVSNIGVWENYKGLNVDYGKDCYGNPSVVWTYKKANGTVLFEKAYTLNPTYSSTKPVNFASLLSEEVASDKDYDLYYYVDGDYKGTLPLKQISMEQLSGLSGKGVLTNVYIFDGERYVDKDNHIQDTSCIVVTFKNTYIDVVTATTYASSKFVVDGMTFDNSKYGFEEGDIILYWLCGKDADDLHDAKIAEPVATDVERVTYDERLTNMAPTATAVSADGKTYEYAKNLFNSIGQGHGYAENIIIDVTGSDKNGSKWSTYDLYLDEYGYIIAWWETNSKVERDVAYYVRNSLKGESHHYENGQYVTVYTAEFIGMDGKSNTVTLTDNNAGADDVRALMAVDAGSRDGYGALVTYKKVGEKVDLDPMPTLEQATYFGNSTGVDYYINSRGDLVKKDGKVFMSGTSTTKYLVKTGSTYTAYNYWELPGDLYSSDEGNGTLNNGRDQSYAIQYFNTNDGTGRLLSYVFIDAKYTLDNTIAFVGAYEKTISGSKFADSLKDKNYRAYNAIIEGEKAYLAVDDTYVNQLKLGSEFVVVKAALKYIGVTDGTVPVYTLVNYERYELDHEDTVLLSKDMNFISVTDGTATQNYRTYKLAEDCTIAVAKALYEDTKWVDGSAKIDLVDRDELAGIVHDFNTVTVGGTLQYELDNAWFYFNEKGEISDLFISTNGLTEMP